MLTRVFPRSDRLLNVLAVFASFMEIGRYERPEDEQLRHEMQSLLRIAQ